VSRRGALTSLAAVGALLVCAGCGYKGPLYLPERNATVVTHPAQGAQGATRSNQTQTPAAKDKSKTPPGQTPPAQTPPA
jgi:predicted small lipoprotein YifL